MDLHYDSIETQLADALPEIRPAAEYYWQTEGPPGADCGPYIFYESLFACYMEVLLFIPDSPRRNELLSRAFQFTEVMLACTDDVANLAYIALLEGGSPEWFARAKEFIGPRAKAELNRYQSFWKDWAKVWDPTAVPEIIDLYGVRHVIASELKTDRVRLEDIPGTTYTK